MKKFYMFLLVLIFSGCAASSPKIASSIEGSWGEDIPDNPNLVFDNGRVYGSTGCNRLMGSYQVDGNSIRLTKVATTMMACRINERLFLDKLNSVDEFEINNSELILKSKSQEVLRFERAK